jgi:hypothetical protein
VNHKFILIDFSCGRFYTHHSSYIFDYAEFISKNGHHVCVCVNDSADADVASLFSRYDFSAILKSSNYGTDRKKHLVRFLQEKLYKNIFTILKFFTIKEVYIESLKSFLSKNYVESAVKYLETKTSNIEQITLVFPTTDSLSFRLIERLANLNYPNISRICVRITGAEKRGIFGVQNSELRLSIIERTAKFKLAIGVETDIYKHKFNKIDNNSKMPIYWAPMPSVARSIRSKLSNDTIVQIGFLGSARKDKGFEDIPQILRVFAQNKVKFHATIQKPIFEWENSSNIIQEVNSDFENQVTWLRGGISRYEIEDTISKMNWLFLPYNTGAYQYAGSGIMFIAADLFVPIISNKEVAFAWDLDNFDIGITYKNYEDLKLDFAKLNKSNFKNKILNYNLARNYANNIFLNL